MTRRYSYGLLAIIIIIVLGGAYYGYKTHTTSTPAPGGSSGPVSPPGSVLMFGAHADVDKLATFADAGTSEKEFTDLQNAVGEPIAIDSTYSKWDDFSTSKPLVQAKWDVANGRTPMISWFSGVYDEAGGKTCATAADIAAGKWDTQLIDQAHELASLGAPIIIRLFPALDTFTPCLYGFDPATNHAAAGKLLIPAWQHIVTLMRASGATNVKWDFSPGRDVYTNSKGVGSSDWKYFYPGDAYVDYLGTQAYNQSLTDRLPKDEPALMTFYKEASATGKDVMLSETGALGPDPQSCGYTTGLNPSAQAVWFKGFEDEASTTFPALKAIVYFDSPAMGTSYNCSDVIIRGDGITALRAMLSDPYFQRRAP